MNNTESTQAETREFDAKNMTWCFSDGSGVITFEQKCERDLLKTDALMEDHLPSKAKKIFNYLTFFSL